MIQKVQKCSRRFKNLKEGSINFKNILRGLEMFQKFQKCSKGLSLCLVFQFFKKKF